VYSVVLTASAIPRRTYSKHPGLGRPRTAGTGRRASLGSRSADRALNCKAPPVGRWRPPPRNADRHFKSTSARYDPERKIIRTKYISNILRAFISTRTEIVFLASGGCRASSRSNGLTDNNTAHALTPSLSPLSFSLSHQTSNNVITVGFNHKTCWPAATIIITRMSYGDSTEQRERTKRERVSFNETNVAKTNRTNRMANQNGYNVVVESLIYIALGGTDAKSIFGEPLSHLFYGRIT